MRKLFEFIRSIYVVVLFVALEVAAISYYAHSTHYTQARLLARSNQVAGGVHGFFAGIRRYFSLGHENRLLLGRVAQLEERLAQYEEAETNAHRVQTASICWRLCPRNVYRGDSCVPCFLF